MGETSTDDDGDDCQLLQSQITNNAVNKEIGSLVPWVQTAKVGETTMTTAD